MGAIRISSASNKSASLVKAEMIIEGRQKEKPCELARTLALIDVPIWRRTSSSASTNRPVDRRHMKSGPLRRAMAHPRLTNEYTDTTALPICSERATTTQPLSDVSISCSLGSRAPPHISCRRPIVCLSVYTLLLIARSRCHRFI